MPAVITDTLDSIYRLPIATRKDEIIAAVDNNQVTIITAETGAGKSTQVPQYLAEHGYTKVIVTQPRILAARNLSSRVRQEYSWHMGSDCTKLIGYRTAHEQDDDPENVILYCTDGLQLVRELTGNGTSQRQVLILDEIHEWNENMEVLIAWAKRRCQQEPRFKLVLMSATIEADSLARYFDAPAPLSIAGRSYPVEKRSAPNLITEIKSQMSIAGSNILVFLPGKAEIEQVAEDISYAADKTVIIPLHSQLELEDQQKAFQAYPDGKVILATNIAQTSITIDDIDVVIDSGLERRAEVRNGVEGLFISEVSGADCLQRAGRTGRTKAGIYVLARYDRLPCTPLSDRPPYGVPEIMRKHVDRLVLRLANVGIDIEDLEFFHAPSKNTIKQAKRTLELLGALKNGQLTTIGKRMERFPVESTYGRMLVESDRLSDDVQSALATIISIQEVGGIVKGGPRHSGWQRYNSQNQSDLIAQYNLLVALPTIPEDTYEDLGIIAKNVDKANEVRGRLGRDLGIGHTLPIPLEPNDYNQIMKCIVAGQIHQIWALDSSGEAVHVASSKRREVSGTTVVRQASLFVGTPFDLEIATPNGLDTLHLVNGLTTIDPMWLQELAPDLFKIQTGKIYYDNYLGSLAAPTHIKFRGRSIETSGTPILERTAANQKLFVQLYSSWLQQQLDNARHASGSHIRNIPSIPLKRIQEKVYRYVSGASSLAELPKYERSELYKLGKLETWLSKEQIESIEQQKQSARSHTHQSKRNHGWNRQDKPGDRWRHR